MEVDPPSDAGRVDLDMVEKGPEGERVYEDVLCTLDLRARVDDGVHVRRLEAKGAADLDPARGSRPPCALGEDDWRRLELSLEGAELLLADENAIESVHGRMHAPCQTYDADPGYPHPNGQIGSWGYDLIQRRVFPPQTPDIMGYCTPQWISDYTFGALLERVRIVNQAMASAVALYVSPDSRLMNPVSTAA